MQIEQSSTSHSVSRHTYLRNMKSTSIEPSTVQYEQLFTMSLSEYKNDLNNIYEKRTIKFANEALKQAYQKHLQNKFSPNHLSRLRHISTSADIQREQKNSLVRNYFQFKSHSNCFNFFYSLVNQNQIENALRQFIIFFIKAMNTSYVDSFMVLSTIKVQKAMGMYSFEVDYMDPHLLFGLPIDREHPPTLTAENQVKRILTLLREVLIKRALSNNGRENPPPLSFAECLNNQEKGLRIRMIGITIKQGAQKSPMYNVLARLVKLITSIMPMERDQIVQTLLNYGVPPLKDVKIKHLYKEGKVIMLKQFIKAL